MPEASGLHPAGFLLAVIWLALVHSRPGMLHQEFFTHRFVGITHSHWVKYRYLVAPVSGHGAARRLVGIRLGPNCLTRIMRPMTTATVP